jgi:hypothetical protein
MRLTDEHRAEITYWIRENMSPGDELTTDQIADLEALLESEQEWKEEADRLRGEILKNTKGYHLFVLENKVKIYRHALNQIVDLLEKDYFENWDKCVQIAEDVLKY